LCSAVANPRRSVALLPQIYIHIVYHANAFVKVSLRGTE